MTSIIISFIAYIILAYIAIGIISAITIAVAFAIAISVATIAPGIVIAGIAFIGIIIAAVVGIRRRRYRLPL